QKRVPAALEHSGKPRQLLEQLGATLHELDAVKEHSHPEYRTQGMSPVRSVERERSAGEPQQIENRQSQIQDRGENQRTTANVGPSHNREDSTNRRQSRGHKADKNEHDAGRAL